ncbi:MAG: hypothetical protein HY924_08465 [Elusimicrobia bacterium]|nr:hypothetical protein [Elusimicrobiota bacterium]
MAKEWLESNNLASVRTPKPKHLPSGRAAYQVRPDLIQEDLRNARKLDPRLMHFVKESSAALGRAATSLPNGSVGAGARSRGDRVQTLIEELKGGGFLNDGLPLYDLRDSAVRREYDAAVLKAPAHSGIRDKASWEDIKAVVTKHVAKHGQGALIVAMGAGTHMYGAVPELEKTAGIRYISATPLKLKVSDIQIPGRELIGSEDILLLRTQIDMSIGVVKELGYRDLQSFLAARSLVKNPANIMIGVEETGLHHLYDRGDQIEKRVLFGILMNYLANTRPATVLCIGESWDAEEEAARFSDKGMPRFYAREQRILRRGLGPGRTPWADLIITAKQMGIPVYFGGFGGDVLEPETLETLEQFQWWLRRKFMPKKAELQRFTKNLATLSRYTGKLPGWCGDDDAEVEARVLLRVSDYGGPRKLFPEVCKEASAFPVYCPRTSTEMALKLLRKSPQGKRIVDFLIQEEVSVGYAEVSSGVLADYRSGLIVLSPETMAYDPLEKALLIVHEGCRAMNIEQGLKPSLVLESSAEKMQADVCQELVRAGVPPLLRPRIKGRRHVENGVGLRL